MWFLISGLLVHAIATTTPCAGDNMGCVYYPNNDWTLQGQIQLRTFGKKWLLGIPLGKEKKKLTEI